MTQLHQDIVEGKVWRRLSEILRSCKIFRKIFHRRSWIAGCRVSIESNRPVVQTCGDSHRVTDLGDIIYEEKEDGVKRRGLSLNLRNSKVHLRGELCLKRRLEGGRISKRTGEKVIR